MLQYIHKTTAISAYLLILAFFTSTLLVELLASDTEIILIKKIIFYTVFLLVPLMATAGITGNIIARGIDNATVSAKKKRMPIIALNGICILIPLAYVLHTLAQENAIDSFFFLIQGIELLFGALNIYLMTRNMLDGKNIKGISRKSLIQ